MTSTSVLDAFVPPALRDLADPARSLPRLAKDADAVQQIDAAVRGLPTKHEVVLSDARTLELPSRSVHLVLTSPPYWTLKEYPQRPGQLGWINDYEDFLVQLDDVWRIAYDALVPGGRLVCVVGDVCLSRRKNSGRHTVVPLHASIQEHCRAIGFDNLAPIIWNKIANAVYEVERGAGGFLGKPYEPNAVVKNDIEFILMQRKPGGYRRPSMAARVLSVISQDFFKKSFRQVWSDIPGASVSKHPAPYPFALAERLIRMFSFAGDTVLDPFVGTGTTQLAASSCGRNSIGVEVDPDYWEMAIDQLNCIASDLLTHTEVTASIAGDAPQSSSSTQRS